MPIPPGTRINNRYEVEQRLGPSGQAEVYVAKDLYEGGHPVALKLMVTFPQGRTWFEAQALRRLQDPHILPIRNAEIDSASSQPFIVTELATHGTTGVALEERGPRGLDVDDVVRWMQQACRGIARAHDASLVHNDLKPGNLFLNAQGECLVGDFGAATLIAAGATTTAPFVATPETTAPEVASAWGTPAASFSSDVYGLGATAYCLLSARWPCTFPAGATFGQKLAIVAEGPSPPRLFDLAPHVPGYVASAIEKALSRAPGDRFANASEFAAALGQRPEVKRRWLRTDDHEAHLACWHGDPVHAGNPYLVCLEQGTTPKQAVITARQLNTGRRITAGCRTVAMRDSSQALRSVMRTLS